MTLPLPKLLPWSPADHGYLIGSSNPTIRMERAESLWHIRHTVPAEQTLLSRLRFQTCGLRERTGLVRIEVWLHNSVRRRDQWCSRTSGRATTSKVDRAVLRSSIETTTSTFDLAVPVHCLPSSCSLLPRSTNRPLWQHASTEDQFDF